MKKVLFVLAGILLISSMAFAGGSKSSSSSSDPNYPITIRVYHETAGHPQPSASNPIYTFLKDKLNVTFEWDILVGDAAQKSSIMIASGDLPDVVELRSQNYSYAAFVDAGALIPLESKVETSYPSIKTHFGDIWNQMKDSKDGHVYHLVNYGITQGKDQNPSYDATAFWIQKEVLRDAGYPTIRTVDEYFNLIESYMKKYPSINGQATIPFLMLTDDWRAFELWNPPNFLAGNPNDGNGVVTQSGNSYKYNAFFTMDISKRWFQKLNELDKRNLIDRSSFTDNIDAINAKIASGRALGMSVQYWQIGTANNSLRENGMEWRQWVPLPVTWPGVTPHYRNLPIPNLLHGTGITTKAKDPDRILHFIEQFITEDIQRTINWGIEGKDWQWNDQKQPYRTAEQRANWQNTQWQEQNRGLLLGDAFPKIQGSFKDGYPSDLGQYYPEREATLSESDRAVFAAYGATGTNDMIDKNPPPNTIWFPTWNMGDPEPGSAGQVALQRCEQTMKQRLPAMVLAPTNQFETLWTQYVQEMTVTNNLPAYEAAMQAKLDQRIKDRSK